MILAEDFFCIDSKHIFRIDATSKLKIPNLSEYANSLSTYRDNLTQHTYLKYKSAEMNGKHSMFGIDLFFPYANHHSKSKSLQFFFNRNK